MRPRFAATDLRKSLSLRYGLALGLVALFVTAGHYISVIALDLQECREDAIASLQTQIRSVDRIAFLVTAIDRDPESAKYLLADLKRTIAQFEAAHASMADPDPEFSLSKATRGSLRHIYFDGAIPFSGTVDEYLRRAKTVVETMTSGGTSQDPAVEAVVLAGGHSVSGTLQMIKKILGKDANDALDTAEAAEFYVWIAALMLLSLEAAFIFRPMVARVEKSVREAAESAASLARVETANVVKTNMLRNVGHELRTPLNAIMGQSILLKHTELSADQYEMIGDIESAGHALIEQIDDLLDLTKLISGEFEIREETFGLRETVVPLVRNVEERARSKGIGLSLSVDRETPNDIWADPAAVQQVLTHILSNAVKFTDQGEISVRIGPGGRASNGTYRQLCFEVEDTGRGISRSRLSHIFDAFEQADGSLTRIHGGTGLGLALSRRIVELMGGQIGVESDLERGSRFWFSIPLRTLAVPSRGKCEPQHPEQPYLAAGMA